MFDISQFRNFIISRVAFVIFLARISFQGIPSLLKSLFVDDFYLFFADVFYVVFFSKRFLAVAKKKFYFLSLSWDVFKVAHYFVGEWCWDARERRIECWFLVLCFELGTWKVGNYCLTFRNSEISFFVSCICYFFWSGYRPSKRPPF